MTKKETKVKLTTTFQYLQLMNGVFELTDTEMEILAAFIDQYKIIQSANLDINPFSTQIKKKVADSLGRDDFNTLNNYIKKMHDKGILRKTVNGYVINQLLIPNREKQLIFNLEWIDKD